MAAHQVENALLRHRTRIKGCKRGSVEAFTKVVAGEMDGMELNFEGKA